MSSYIPAAYRHSQAPGSAYEHHSEDPSSSHTTSNPSTTPYAPSRDEVKYSSASPDGVPSNATPAGEPYASAAAAAASEAAHTDAHTHTHTDTHTDAHRRTGTGSEEGEDARTHAKDVMDATRAVSRGLVGDVDTWVQAARAARKGDVEKAQTLLEGKSKGPHVDVGTKVRKDREGRVLRSWEFLNDAGDVEVDTYKCNEARLTGRYEKETLLYPRPEDGQEEGTLQQEYGGFVF